MSQPRTNQRTVSSKLSRFISLLSVTLVISSLNCIYIGPVESAPQTSTPASWMSRVGAALSGQSLKLSGAAPLVQFDTGSKYLEVLVDEMMQNFKKSVVRANDKVSSRYNVTSLKAISLVSSPSNQRFGLVDLQVDGLQNPKISGLHLKRENLKLNLSFNYKNIRVTGRCVTNQKNQPTITDDHKPILEVTGWNATWSATLPHMIGRDHFDMHRVHVNHGQQRMSFNFKDCPQSIHDKLKSALVNRVESVIEDRIHDVMEMVVFEADKNKPKVSANPQHKSPSDAKVLKRQKRQTPCQQGEELDDYVDELLRFGGRLVRAMEPVTLPNVTIELPEYNLKIFLYEGKGTRASKIRRVKPAWVFCNNDTTSLGITVEIEELQAAYKYRVISGYRLIFDGDLEARLTPRAQAQFSQAKQDEDSTDPVQQRVDRVRLFRLGKVHVIIRGLGNLTQSLSMMINSYLNDNQDELQPTFRMFEGDAVRVANRALATVNVPLLSVV